MAPAILAGEWVRNMAFTELREPVGDSLSLFMLICFLS